MPTIDRDHPVCTNPCVPLLFTNRFLCKWFPSPFKSKRGDWIQDNVFGKEG